MGIGETSVVRKLVTPSIQLEGTKARPTQVTEIALLFISAPFPGEKMYGPTCKPLTASRSHDLQETGCLVKNRGELHSQQTDSTATMGT